MVVVETPYPPTCAGFTEGILMGLTIVIYSMIFGYKNKVRLTLREGKSGDNEVSS